MTGFILGHFVNGIVNGVEIELLSPLGDGKLTFACACLSSCTQFKILFCGGRYNFAEKFSKFCCMFCLFIGITLESFCNFGISFALCNPCHCKVHAYFGAFTGEVSMKAVHNFFIIANAVAYNMLASKLGLIGSFNGDKGLSMANGANFYIICYDFAAYGTSFHD